MNGSQCGAAAQDIRWNDEGTSNGVEPDITTISNESHIIKRAARDIITHEGTNNSAQDIIRNEGTRNGAHQGQAASPPALSSSCLQAAKEIIKSMESYGVDPNRVTHNTILRIAVSDPRVSEAQMKSLFAAIPEPNKISYGTLMQGLASVSEQEKVIEQMVLRGLEVDPPISSRLLFLHNVQCVPPFDDEGLICSPAALELLRKYETWGIELSTLSFNALLSPLSRYWAHIPLLRRKNQVLSWRTKMRKAGIEENEYIKHEFMKILQDDREEAETVFASMRKPLPKSHALLAEIFANAKDVGAIEAIWKVRQDEQIGLAMIRALSSSGDAPSYPGSAAHAETVFRTLVAQGQWSGKSKNAQILQSAVGASRSEQLLREIDKGTPTM